MWYLPACIDEISLDANFKSGERVGNFPKFFVLLPLLSGLEWTLVCMGCTTRAYLIEKNYQYS
jgi:hypothetical protein